MDLSRPFKEDRRAFYPLSTPWFCTRRWRLKLLNTFDLPRRKPLVTVAFPASLSARSLISFDSNLSKLKTAL